MNQQERLIITLISLIESEKKLEKDFLIDKLRACITLIRPEKVILGSITQIARFETLVREYKNKGIIA